MRRRSPPGLLAASTNPRAVALMWAHVVLRAGGDTPFGVAGGGAAAGRVVGAGSRPERYAEHVEPREDVTTKGDGSPIPGVIPEPVRPEAPAPESEAPAPSRADVGRPEVDAR